MVSGSIHLSSLGPRTCSGASSGILEYVICWGVSPSKALAVEEVEYQPAT